ELGNLIAIYDSNQISIEDDTDIAYSENVRQRYEAYGWQVLEVDWRSGDDMSADGYREDLPALYAAIAAAKAESGKPTLIILKTIIGWPSPGKQNTGGIHGSALGADELAGLKRELGFDPEQHFEVAPEVIGRTRGLIERAAEDRATWQEGFDAWSAAHPDRKALLDRLEAGELPDDIQAALPVFEAGTSVAPRSASGK